MEYKHLYNVNSKTFGDCLCINLYSSKICTFDCLYCYNPKENKYAQRVFIFPVSKIIKEIEDYSKNNPIPDYIWYHCQGEPPLYMLFGELNNKIKNIYPDVKLALTTNCSLIFREDVRKEMELFDLIVAKFDTVIDEEFQKINRPHEMINLNNIITNLREFRKTYKGKFWFNSVFLMNYNTSENSLQSLKLFVKELLPEKFIITYEKRDKFEQIPDEVKTKIESFFSDIPVEINYGIKDYLQK